ncbi:hypothetical protein BGZ63DRAFT_92399 [Mariannaea sp. PMI_226]|nr:hypothetical protein BGZ63DRAFT_92399 [Mariannaea sp. PMI_226]
MAAGKEILGSIVSFEGHAETISTQLRLLPTSPQILILPSIQSYLPKDDLQNRFDARLYVKKIHHALMVRNEIAHSFLKGSDPNSKRLVFMNGGTPGAQVLCIKAIMEHETHGNYPQAEAIFSFLVKDGIAGLENPNRDWKRRNTFQYFGGHSRHEELEDPITRAMRAADALDRQTESLQPSNELDLTTGFRARSNSLPLYGYTDNFGDAAPFFVFGAKGHQEEPESASEDVIEEESNQTSQRSSRISRSSIFAITHYEKPAEELFPGFTHIQPPSPKTKFPRSPSCIGETYAAKMKQGPLGPEVFTPRSEGFSVRSTDNVVYGEASLLDMRVSGRRASLNRVKSLDRIYPAAPKYRDLCIPSESPESEKEAERKYEEEITPGPGRRHSCMVITSSKDSRSTRLSYIEGPRTILVRSNRPRVKMVPVPEEKKPTPARASYVDRGTDAEKVSDEPEPFKPVLPFLEDLVVLFQDEGVDDVFEAVVRSFRPSSHISVFNSLKAFQIKDTSSSTPGTPKSEILVDPKCVDESFQEQTVEVVTRSSYTDDYDPFDYVQPTWPQPKALNKKPLHIEGPPTPARTPTPPLSESEDKILEFKIMGHKTAVVIQNSLRSILKVHFPPDTQGYRQFQFPVLPELEGLWRPIFQDAESGGSKENNRTMDQIFAIGAQRGVRKNYVSAITGQLEKLGTKSSGMSRSGRLDFRYLLANAMQAFTAQPLTSQTHDNPFTNPYLLATLIIPHLETYIALHTEVKFLLLEYPPEHLPTMLALQKLVGVDLMKVAQVVDSNSKDLPFTNLRGPSSLNSPDQGCAGRYGSSLPSAGVAYDVTVSRANFLLTSTASESEIATFISTVLKILREISSFYTPEEPVKKPTPKKEKPKLAPLQASFSPFPRVSSVPQSPILSPPLSAKYGTAPPPSPSIYSRAGSIAETIKTMKSSKSRGGRSRRKAQAADNQSIMTAELSDSDWDQEDRRVMPIPVRRPADRKGNSRKALKFLGLA